MREKNLLQLFLILNVGLAGAFVIYLFVSNHREPKVIATSFPAPLTNHGLRSLLASNRIETAASNPATVTVVQGTNTAATNLPPVAAVVTTNPPAPQAVFGQRKFTWAEVESEDYRTYLNSLRAVGCPEDKIRYIILADINELFAQRRLKEAVAHDIQWWRAEPELTLVNVLQEKGRQLEDERRALIERLLGSEAADEERSEALLWSNVQLTGPVLGKLPDALHNQVQEICARSIERHQAAFWARANEGQPLNQVEMARLREQTRTDLRPLLDDAAMEEFLLRYSHNANRLRQELRGLDPTPQEFRQIFRAIDVLDHQIQLEYGGPETLSTQQRERYERQRDDAIRSALAPERYQSFLLTKDPLYRQAQMMATQYGAPSKTVMPIYQMTKANEVRRHQILNDATLTPEQKSQKLNAVNLDQQRSVQKIVSDAAGNR